MAAMLCAATYSVVFKKLCSRYSVLTLTALQAFVGTSSSPLCLWRTLADGLGLAGHGGHRLSRRLRDPGAYLLYNWSVTQVKVTLAAAYVNLIPVFTRCWPICCWETLNALQWVACGAVLLGIAVGQLPAKRARMPAATTGS